MIFLTGRGGSPPSSRYLEATNNGVTTSLANDDAARQSRRQSTKVRPDASRGVSGAVAEARPAPVAAGATARRGLRGGGGWLRRGPDTARAAALAELATRLAQLMTAEERRTYPALDHLQDLIDDLEGDA